MALTELYDMEAIRNRTAEAVYKRVESLLEEDRNLCRCTNCVIDLVAFVLNRVTPRYTTSALGDLHPDPAQEHKLRIEVDLAIEAGLRRLREHPHHD
jgi:competence protein ComFB